jgi:glycerol-3-phosphate dehydrogenase
LALGHAPIHPGSSCVVGEVRWAIEQEGAATLEDLLYRRTRLPLYGLDPRAAIEPLADRMAEVLGWDPKRRLAQIAHVNGRLDSDLGFGSADEVAPLDA